MWILPSYKRPEQCKAVLDTCVAKGMTTPGVLIINGPAEGYDFDLPEGWKRHHEPENIGFAAALNRGVSLEPEAPWYGVLSDDCYPETDGWDLALVAAAGSRNISHCNDNWHSEKRAAGIVVLGGDLVRALGFLTVPGTWHCYCDDLWEAIWADFNNRRYLRDVICRNPHPMKGDAPVDETIIKAYGPGMKTMEADGVVYRTWMNSKAKRKAWNRIRALFPADEKPKGRIMVYGKNEDIAAPIINVEPRKLDPLSIKVMICTPAVDEMVKTCYATSLFSTLPSLLATGIRSTIRFLTKCSQVEHARNKLAAEFLKSDCTHLLFVDDDMGWPKDAVHRLLSHDKPVIAAVGCTKEFKDRRYCVKLNKETMAYDQKRGLIRVTSVGTGFMLIQRHVIEQMTKIELEAGRGYKTGKDETEVFAPLFEFMFHDGIRYGEDYSFCNKWRAMGGEVWIDPDITIAHAGTHDFVGNYQMFLNEAGAFKEAA